MVPSGDTLYLDWSYTDAPAGVSASDTVDTVPPGGGVPNLIATGAVVVNGSNTTENRFGDISSTRDRPVHRGWRLRGDRPAVLRRERDLEHTPCRVGACRSAVAVPSVAGDAENDAINVIDSAGLVAGTVSQTDPTCSSLGDVIRQSPGAGTLVAPGATVTLFIGQAPPPPFHCP
jgi:hypothetical protein